MKIRLLCIKAITFRGYDWDEDDDFHAEQGQWYIGEVNDYEKGIRLEFPNKNLWTLPY